MTITQILPWPVADIAGWMPLWKGAGFFLATFVLEDAAAIGAGLLLAGGAISWPVAFASCFLGIWMGDAGLYWLARFGGRKWFEQSRLKKFSAKVTACEGWFANRGTLILVFSRCVPGARLPTYLAAGFLRVPLPRFLIVTGAAAFVWTLIVLGLTQILGAQVVRLLAEYKHGGFLLLALAVGFFAAIQLAQRVASKIDLQGLTARVERWRHWEFWPAWLFYPPVGLYCAWLAIKYRGLTVPTASNPGIFSGGLVGESKMVTLTDLMNTSPEFTAPSGLVPGSTLEIRANSLSEIRSRLSLGLPFILKPDFGQRGGGVKLIRSEEQAKSYLAQTAAPLVAQRYEPGPFEAGIFYYRFPGEAHGKIFSITEKIFPAIVGDGVHTIEELIRRDARARFIADTYLKRFQDRKGEVPAAGETLPLVSAGNHAQGCIFRDGQRLWSAELEARVDEISKKLNGFYIGRYDIRYENEDDLRAGENFQIVELNGAASEATSIYDSRNSLWSAYRTLFRQWELVFAIGAENRRRGIPLEKFLTVWRKRREFLQFAATYPVAD